MATSPGFDPLEWELAVAGAPSNHSEGALLFAGVLARMTDEHGVVRTDPALWDGDPEAGAVAAALREHFGDADVQLSLPRGER